MAPLHTPQIASPFIHTSKEENPPTNQTKNNVSDMISPNKEKIESNNLKNDP